MVKPGNGTGDGTTGEDYYLYGGGRDGLVCLFSIKLFFQLKTIILKKSLFEKVK